tara:strand:+ start:183 stop:380 length:198 start_codon:yes stop_codon:yes gene_type:complete
MTQSTSQNVTEEMNIELLNVINEDVESVKQWSQMSPISDELYQELVKEFNNERHYFFNDSYTLEG